jgi:hypothetical protein
MDSSGNESESIIKRLFAYFYRTRLKVIRTTIIVALCAATLLSFPQVNDVLGISSFAKPILQVDPSPDIAQLSAEDRAIFDRWYAEDASRIGAVPTFGISMQSSSFVVVAWKGSIHLQYYSDSRDAPASFGFHITQAAQLVNSGKKNRHWVDDLYINSFKLFDIAGIVLKSQPSSRFPGRSGVVTAVAIPLWMPLLIIVGYGAYKLRRRQSLRGTPVVCANCGYDLRATVDRCPECGLEKEVSR